MNTSEVVALEIEFYRGLAIDNRQIRGITAIQMLVNAAEHLLGRRGRRSSAVNDALEILEQAAKGVAEEEAKLLKEDIARFRGVSKVSSRTYRVPFHTVLTSGRRSGWRSS